MGSVTPARLGWAAQATLFQYPLSDRGLCNQLHGTPLHTLPGSFSILYRIVGSVTRGGRAERELFQCFQYPLSDRGLCNLGFRLQGAGAVSAFSILYRIVGSVTSFAAHLGR